MPADLPRLADGDAVEPYHLNDAYRELRRLRRLQGAGGVVAEGFDGNGGPKLSLARGERFDLKLTGAYASGYPWKEVVRAPDGTWSDTGVTGGPATGDPAFERRTGVTTLTAGARVYQAVRSPASGQPVFAARATADDTVALPGCACPVVPTTLTVAFSPTTNNGSPAAGSLADYSSLGTRILTYGTIPSAWAAGGFGGPTSKAFVAVGVGQTYFGYDFDLRMTCSQRAYTLDMVSPAQAAANPFLGGSEFLAFFGLGTSPLYPGVTNTCLPFDLKLSTSRIWSNFFGGFGRITDKIHMTG